MTTFSLVIRPWVNRGVLFSLLVTILAAEELVTPSISISNEFELEWAIPIANGVLMDLRMNMQSPPSGALTPSRSPHG